MVEPESSCLIAREVFVDWAKRALYLSKNGTIIRYNENLANALRLAESLNHSNIYWIWWIDNGTWQLWYGQPVPTTFNPVHQEGSIAIYKYSGP
jgi:hypothetical protein